jgi:formate C-acetyltransferase
MAQSEKSNVQSSDLWGKDNTFAACWEGFKTGSWKDEINVRDFIVRNYTLYEGDDSFLKGATEATKQLWDKVSELTKQERDKGILDADTKVVASITAHDAGYIDNSLEEIVGLQTDKPLKRAIMPAGGARMVENGLEAYGYKLDEQVSETYNGGQRKSHNQGVFDAYTSEIRAARKSGIVTGLPDAYGRGRIIGDYRRVALYGIDRLIEDKKAQAASTENMMMTEDVIRAREEFSEQIRALADMKEMGAKYGYDLGKPALNAKEAIQWTYFGYLAAVK